MQKFMSYIYRKQEGITPDCNSITVFLGENNDTEVLIDILKKKLSGNEKLQIEEKLTKKELTEQLMKHMNPFSGSGMDGFTVA